MAKKYYESKNAMFLQRRSFLRGFVETQVVRVADKKQRAVMLVECEVNDPERFGYFEGSWYKLEQLEGPSKRQARTVQMRDAHGTYEMVECSPDDEFMLFEMDGICFKLAS